MTSDVPNILTIEVGSMSCDVTHGNFKLRYLDFGK